ncbi:hypothetical protein JR316_0003078 [Psilocybe cubensis]|uniref:Uncharacterized protein n=2 Tax=Psilocybe cubensis TaxID=181762 RepID=A0A8H8CMT4_PSICU|nr:hypothetical protein JR316_0003078 [Psilocybe cubensis]KAH9483608.1 hypothetical protein JR316_0003078 [Psilocybe cubensis]
MPSKKHTQSVLEKQISKTIALYIDSAITAPPKHQPYHNDVRDFTHVFEVFWKEDFSGIDLDAVYKRKPDDPSWLSYFSDHKINAVRLVLAVRDRDINLVLVEGQPPPAPAVDSVSLKDISYETFAGILRGLVRATKKLEETEISITSEIIRYLESMPNQTCEDELSDGFYEEFKLLRSKVDIHQAYATTPEEPDWLARYSNQAINIVRIVVLLRAYDESAASVLESFGDQELSLEYVVFEDVSLQDFLDVFRQLVGAERRLRRKSEAENSLDIMEPPSSDSDTASEHEADEKTIHAKDAPPRSIYELDFVGSESTLHDDQEDVIKIEEVEFDTEEEFRRQLEQWDVHEALEDLPEDIIGPLLEDSKTRRITIAILRKALDVKGSTNTAINRNLNIILHELRREYRIAHTPSFLYGMEYTYQRPVTPFIYGYLALSSVSYVLRSRCRALKTPTASNLVANVDITKDDLTATVEELKSFPVFQEVMLDRVRMMNTRVDIYQDVISHCIEIGSALQTICVFNGPANKPHFTLDPGKCRDLRTAIEDFTQFDDAMLDKNHFQEFPGCMVKVTISANKASGILTLFKNIIDLKYTPVCMQNEDLVNAVDGATVLHSRWHKRSTKSENSLYFPLQPESSGA